MRYRKLDENGDMLFGHGAADYLRDSPACVAQAAVTRLRLMRGEWFLDVEEGTPYVPSILGKHTEGARDLALRERILGTPGLREIQEYESGFDPDRRKFSVNVRVDTVYGQAIMREVF